jgi:hypothetical protein
MVMTGVKNRRWEELEKDSIDLIVLAKHFELYNRTEGESARTIDWYNEAIGLLKRFLEENCKPTNIGNLGELEAREFIIYLQERSRWQDNPHVTNNRGKLAAITIQTHVRALRGFFNRLYRDCDIEKGWTISSFS